MARSQSDNEGQYPVVCQICEEEIKLNWKCVDCEMLMCHKCKEKIHPKFKFADDHRIINIKDVGVENQGNEKPMDYSKIKCLKHPQVVTLYCESCDQLACSSCMIQLHKKHDLMEIYDGYKIKIEKLREAKLKIEEENENLNTEIRKLEDMKTTKEFQYNEVNQNILLHETVLIAAVQEYGKILRGELEEKYRSIQKTIDQEIDHIHQLEKDADNKVVKLELHIDTKDAADFFKNLPTEEDTCMVIKQSINRTNMTLPQFVPKMLNPSDIGILEIETITMIEMNSGEKASTNSSTTVVEQMKTNPEETMSVNCSTAVVEQMNMKTKKTMPENYSTTAVEQLKMKTEETILVNPNFKVVNKYDTGIPNISDIVACLDGSLWINSCSKEELLKLKPNDKTLQYMSSYKVEVYSMALTPANDLLFSPNESRLSIIYNDTGKLRKTKYDVAPLWTVNVRVSGDYVIVGAQNTNNMQRGRRAVIVMDKDGDHVARYERNVQNKPILNNIIDLTLTEDDIFVVDGLIGMNIGCRVVVLRQGGHTSSYKGHPCINSENKPFAPLQIATAPSTNVVVYDTSTDAFHILNDSAQLLKHLYLHETGLPINKTKDMDAMCFSTDNWYIGLPECSDSPKQTILYQLDVSDCSELRKKTDEKS